MNDVQANDPQQPSQPEHQPRWGRAMWGLTLVAAGLYFLLDHLGYTEVPSIDRIWPAAFFLVGLNHLFTNRPGGAVTFVLIGVWVFACNEGWWGFDYSNSWGLVLVAVGAGIVIRTLSGEDRRRRHRLRRGGVL